MSDNLALWNSVEATDAAYTKAFKRGGGFSGTAVNPTWLAKRATEVWGPIGIGWGIDVIEEKLIPGRQFYTEAGLPLAQEMLHVCKVRLWYRHGETIAEVFHYGATELVTSNKNGVVVDEEAFKKSMTDGLSKCLSMLGFSADVYLGRFDDSKYVNDAKEKAATMPPWAQPAGDTAVAPATPVPPPTAFKAQADTILAEIDAAGDTAAINAVLTRHKAALGIMERRDPSLHAEIKARVVARRKTLTEGEAA